MSEKWMLDVGANQYALAQGKLYLIGCFGNGGDFKMCADITIKSQSVDAKHCVLDATGTVLCIYDLKSDLGTFVNGKRLESMIKEYINSEVDLCIGAVTGRLYFKQNQEEQLNSSTEVFLAPTHRAPRSSLANTSTRLFSSPDVSLVSSVTDDSFNIPETQHAKQRQSNGSCKSTNDDSFIPETQMPMAAEEISKTLAVLNAGDEITQRTLQQTDELIRMCTQDFNENLFGEGVDEETFTSLVIPNIQHKPVILTHDVYKNLNKEDSKLSCNAEMEALNWSAPSSKCTTIDNAAQNTQCMQRDDVCTPDLFDLPELAEMNIQTAIVKENDIIDMPLCADDALQTREKVDSNKHTDGDGDNVMREGVNSGDGYAEEIDMNPTQVFIPIPKQSKTLMDPTTQVFIPATKKDDGSVAVETVATDITELSLSGKENMPHTDISFEQTQIFPMSKALENKCKLLMLGASNPTTNDGCDRDLSMLPPTQIFSHNQSYLVRQAKKMVEAEADQGLNLSKVQQNLNSTLVPTVDNYNAKSLASFFENIEHTEDKAESESNLSCFKKPKQSKSSSKSASSKRSSKETSTNVNNSQQTETEDLHLCTPKWILDNFDELPIEETDAKPKKRMLFGSDSEDESVELNKLTTKKDSKDFDRLLVNVKEAKRHNTKTQTDVGKSKSGLVKREEKLTVDKKQHNHKSEDKVKASTSATPTKTKMKTYGIDNQALKIGEQKAKKVENKEDKSTDKKIAKFDKDIHSFDLKSESASAREGASVHTTNTSDRKQQQQQRRITRSTSVDKKTSELIGAPADKRLTRLRSITTSDLDCDKASSSANAPHSGAKQRKKQQKDEIKEAIKTGNKERLTRSRSKTKSQESLTSSKSAGPSQTTSIGGKRGNSPHNQNKNDPSYNSSLEASKSTNNGEGSKNSSPSKISSNDKDRSNRKRSKSSNASSDAEPKRLRNSSRTLQVAMTMVEPKLFQSLLDNSPGNWCLASEPTNADILVMDKGNRTLKFLIAMAKGIPIVTSKWLECLNSTKSVPRGITYFFRDKEFEKRHKFSLLKSLELARKRKIFDGYDFLMTPSILPQPAEMKQIIECAGGKVHSETPASKPNQKVYLISSCNDKKHWHKYRRSNNNIRITSSEGVMESVMRQITEPLDSNVFV